EYYDSNRRMWVMVDPTWGNTTRGIDYFNTFDFDHITFVREGRDSKYPVPAGGYKANGNTKDVSVALAEKSDFRDIIKSDAEILFPDKALSGFPIGGVISIKNTGNVPIQNQTLKVSSDLSPNTV